MTRTSLGKEPHDPWGKIAHQYPQLDEDGRKREDYGRVGLFEAIKRFFVLLFWRPASTIAYMIGLVYGSVCIYLFAHGDMLQPYLATVEVNKNAETHTPPDTLVVSPDGILMLLVWVLVPPLWFFIESYVLCKTPPQRAMVMEAQNISVKVWLALLGVMAILAK